MKYLIAYQLFDLTDADFDDVPNEIYNIDQSAMNCFGDVWVVSTELPASEIKKRIEPVLEPTDRLVVSEFDPTKTQLVGFDRTSIDKMLEQN